MKLKLNRDELNVLIHSMEDTEHIPFRTKLERQVTTYVLKEFLIKIIKKSIDTAPKISISIDEQTLVALDYVLAFIEPSSPFENSVIRNIHTKINQECLNF